jgi:hypothetical protein
MDEVKKIGEVTFEYSKGSQFQVYSATGVYGGWSPQGELVMSFFRETPALPQSQTYDIMSNGELAGNPSIEQKKDAIVREVFLGLAMNPTAVKNLAVWLNQTIQEYEARVQQMQQGAGQVSH